jgi:hypothetical protein
VAPEPSPIDLKDREAGQKRNVALTRSRARQREVDRDPHHGWHQQLNLFKFIIYSEWARAEPQPVE